MEFNPVAKRYIILSSLINSCDGTIEVMPEDQLFVESVTNELLVEWEKRQNWKYISSQRMQPESTGNMTAEPDSRALHVHRCFNCGWETHLKRNCPGVKK